MSHVVGIPSRPMISLDYPSAHETWDWLMVIGGLVSILLLLLLLLLLSIHYVRDNV